MYDLYITDTLKLFFKVLTGKDEYPRYYEMIHPESVPTEEELEEEAEAIKEKMINKLKGL